MTDIMKLAQEYAVRYRVNRAVDEARAALQSAIEALQAENERLKSEREALRDSAKEVTRLRDQLQSQLDAMDKRDAVEAIRLSDTVEGSHPSFGGGVFATLDSVDIFYTAPKALAPLERVAECAARLVEHADFQLGGILSADSKAKDIPSKAVSQVKSRHLAALRDSLAAHGIGGTP